MEKPESQIIVIFGGSGDLTKRKLIPALYLLYKNGKIPGSFAILGASRTHYTDNEYRDFLRGQLIVFVQPDELIPQLVDNFINTIYYQTMDPYLEEGYRKLKERLAEIDRIIGNPENYLFYLATPPSLYKEIPEHLRSVGLEKPNGEKGIKRIIVEKPFGYDLQSAEKLNKLYRSIFHENQIFRIDHFLGKETVQNILALRFANCIFEPLWNRNYIDHIEITAVENLGIEQRGGFYDGTGALRDMVQNHLIQLVALCAMEPPVLFDADSFRNEIVKVYQALKPLTDEEISTQVVRGQYTASTINGIAVKGYREENNVDPQSHTETFLSMRLYLANWRWDGVPFYIRTGKQMPTKVSEIVIHFKPTPHLMFNCQKECPAPNQLIIRLQPNEGIVLKLGIKVPGSGFEIREVPMDFTYDKLGGVPTGDAYARLLEDCMQGEATLFTRSDAVEASWHFFDPILKQWAGNSGIPLYSYPAGTWGPKASETIKNGKGWTNPCKNLINTDLYCEL